MEKYHAKKGAFILFSIALGLFLSVAAVTASQDKPGVIKTQEKEYSVTVSPLMSGQFESISGSPAMEFSQKEQLQKEKKSAKIKKQEDFRALSNETATKSRKK